MALLIGHYGHERRVIGVNFLFTMIGSAFMLASIIWPMQRRQLRLRDHSIGHPQCAQDLR